MSNCHSAFEVPGRMDPPHDPSDLSLVREGVPGRPRRRNPLHDRGRRGAGRTHPRGGLRAPAGCRGVMAGPTSNSTSTTREEPGGLGPPLIIGVAEIVEECITVRLENHRGLVPIPASLDSVQRKERLGHDTGNGHLTVTDTNGNRGLTRQYDSHRTTGRIGVPAKPTLALLRHVEHRSRISPPTGLDPVERPNVDLERSLALQTEDGLAV